MKALHFPAIFERAKKDHDFPDKIRKARKTNRRERAEAKREASKGHQFSEAAKFSEEQCVGAFTQFTRNRK
jgi:hypothetical protein